MNLERYELVGVQPSEVPALDGSCEFQADVVYGHGQLLVPVDSFKAEGLHLLGIVRIGQEVKQTRPLAVLEKPLAFEFSGVPHDREMHFLPSGFREIES